MLSTSAQVVLAVLAAPNTRWLDVTEIAFRGSLEVGVVKLAVGELFARDFVTPGGGIDRRAAVRDDRLGWSITTLGRAVHDQAGQLGLGV